MDEIDIAENQPELFRVEGQLSEEDAIFLEEIYEIGTKRSTAGEISTPFRAKCHFSIGEPIVLPLAKLLAERGETVSADIQLQMRQYDFYQVQLACSFQAAPGCRFDQARFALTLQTSDPHNAQAVIGEAIAYDLFPLHFEDKREVSVKRSVAPEIKFGFDPASSSIALPLYERSETYVTYTSRVEAFDLGGPKPAWQFTRTASRGIGGPQKLFMIVRKPKGTQVNVTFCLDAQVRFMIGGITDLFTLVMFFHQRSSSSIITDVPTVPLC